MRNDVASPRGARRWSRRDSLNDLLERPYVEWSAPAAIVTLAQPRWLRRIATVVGLIVVAWLVMTVIAWNRDVPGACGPVPASVSATVRKGPSPELFTKLRVMETTGSSARRVAARTARIQCGLVTGPEEVVESFALQLAATGLTFDSANSSWMFAAVTAAKERAETGAEGRVDALEVLRWAQSQPTGSMPAEFERERAAVPDIIAHLTTVRATWK